MADDTDSSRSRSKVGRVIDTYGLDGIEQELAQRWTRDEDRYSLRELAEFFNKRTLESALADAGVDTLDGELDNMYRLLTDDVSGGTRVQARRRLERAGIDVNALENDFVSYQAIRTYLTKYQDVEYERDDTDPVESSRDRILRLQGRMQTVSAGELEELKKRDHISLGEFDVFVNARVYCNDCETQFPIEDLLEERACDC